jgi:O-succinylbenzoic acid--CoA ligase
VVNLAVIPVSRSNSLPDAIARAWDRGYAVAVVDLDVPRDRLRERMQALMPHLMYSYETRDFELIDRNAPPLIDGTAIVVTTSGTTGPPKAIVLTMDNLLASTRAVNSALDIGPHDGWLCPIPPQYIGGLASITRALLSGIPIQVIPGFDQSRVDKALASGATRIVAVTAALGKADLSGFKTVLLGAQPPPSDVPSNSIVSYGLTETGSGVVYDGFPLPGVDLKLEKGEIWLRGPMIARTTRTGTAIVDGDGWLHTGDAGSIVDGRLEVLGRLSDQINTAGHKVSPQRVEEVIEGRLHLKRASFVVVGVPDPQWNQVVTLVVTNAAAEKLPIRDYDPKQVHRSLSRYLAKDLEAHEIPRRIEVTDSIPTTETGKPIRHKLVEKLTRSIKME